MIVINLRKNLEEVFNRLQCPPLFAVQLSLCSSDHDNCRMQVYSSCQIYDKCIYLSTGRAALSVIDRDMISGLTGTGTGMKKCDLTGTGTGTEIINLPGPGPTIQFYRDDRDDRDDRDLTGMTGTKTGILILKAATFIYIIIEQFE